MFGRLLAALICAASLSAMGQTPPSNYQRGTITAVTAHQNAPGESSRDVVRYDVSVKVGNTNYVVLFTPPNGSNTVEYSVGTDMLFLVGDDTLTFNSKVSGKTEMPILRREALPARGSPDLSRAPGEYFSLKLQNLSEKLALSDDQQAKIRPILEQESGELSPLWNNPVHLTQGQTGRPRKSGPRLRRKDKTDPFSDSEGEAPRNAEAAKRAN